MNNRIKAIADAAASLFLRQGYARTQISHIAKAAGISVGSIYNDFNGKQEIMHLVLKCMLEPDFIEQDFKRPITDDLFRNIEDEIVALLELNQEVLKKHLEDNGAGYSFEALISDVFDFLARYAVGSLFIEKNQYDFKYLAEQYKAYRKNFFDLMMSYITMFIANGSIRQMEHPQLAVTMIIEILSWWAMDRRYVSFEASDVPLEQAKAVCLDTIVSAYKN